VRKQLAGFGERDRLVVGDLNHALLCSVIILLMPQRVFPTGVRLTQVANREIEEWLRRENSSISTSYEKPLEQPLRGLVV
jgi:hypothetical protein